MSFTSFTFDFDLEDDLDETFDVIPSAAPSPSSTKLGSTTGSSDTLAHSTEIPFSELLAALPEAISHSPLTIQLTSGRLPATLARRDLFDARYQLIAQEGTTEGDALAFLDAPSDLIPGVYEGGLKTWECSVDLVDYLEGVTSGEGSWVRGKRVLELGCGTAVPSVFLLHELFNSLPTESSSEAKVPSTHIHLQDYNRSVLELVTLPNILLAWYMSPLSLAYRSASVPDPHPEAEENLDDPGAHTPGELALLPALLDAFVTSLATYHIHLRFFSGSWDTLDISPPAVQSSFDPISSQPYDLVLTSETIYKPESLPPLIRVLRTATGASNDRDMSDRFVSLSLEGKGPLCLVAAKLVYFGVGGGVEKFIRAVEGSAGAVETVWEKREGVGRRVMSVEWR